MNYDLETILEAFEAGASNPTSEFATGFVGGMWTLTIGAGGAILMVLLGLMLVWIFKEIWRAIRFNMRKLERLAEELSIDEENITKKKTYGYCPCCGGTVHFHNTFLRKQKGYCCSWCGQPLKVRSDKWKK